MGWRDEGIVHYRIGRRELVGEPGKAASPTHPFLRKAFLAYAQQALSSVRNAFICRKHWEKRSLIPELCSLDRMAWVFDPGVFDLSEVKAWVM